MQRLPRPVRKGNHVRESLTAAAQALDLEVAEVEALCDELVAAAMIERTPLHDTEALHRFVEEFVRRDTTDYGLREKSREEKVADVMRQLERGEATVTFDIEKQTTHIVVVR